MSYVRGVVKWRGDIPLDSSTSADTRIVKGNSLGTTAFNPFSAKAPVGREDGRFKQLPSIAEKIKEHLLS